MLKGVFTIMAKNDDLSLSGLSMPELDTTGLKARFEANMAEQERYRKLYGDGWWEKFCNDKGWNTKLGYDMRAKVINIAIYEHRMCYNASTIQQFYREQELFGERYDELKDRGPCDSRVVELLIADAIKTGKWKELPDELQSEYHKRVGDVL